MSVDPNTIVICVWCDRPIVPVMNEVGEHESWAHLRDGSTKCLPQPRKVLLELRVTLDGPGAVAQQTTFYACPNPKDLEQ